MAKKKAKKDRYQGSDRYPAARGGRFPVRLFVAERMDEDGDLKAAQLWAELQQLPEYKKCPTAARPKKGTVDQACSEFRSGKLTLAMVRGNGGTASTASGPSEAVQKAAVALLAAVGDGDLEPVLTHIRQLHEARAAFVESTGGDAALARRLLCGGRPSSRRKSSRR